MCVVLVHSPVVQNLARKYQKTHEQVFYRFVQQLGILPLSGTTSASHMSDDLALATFALATDELAAIESLL
jgi:diketogulonate reductase-like aldo/keto reductase